MFKNSLVLAATLALGIAPAAHAATLQITANNGVWQGATSSGSGCGPSTSNGGNTISWGDGNGWWFGCGSQSSYDYDPRNTNFNVSTGTAFEVGTFTHVNAAITGAELTSVNLRISMSVAGQSIGFATPFSFVHDETQNPQGDHVVLSLGGPLGFSYAGNNYVFQLLGFKSGQSYVSDFWTKEGKSKELDLYAVINEVPRQNVPEPTSMVLLGAAFLLGGRRLARRRA